MNLTDFIKEEKKHIEKIAESASGRIKNLPSGRLIVSAQRNGQFFEEDSETGKRKYLKKEQIDYIKQLAQKSYEEQVLRACNEQLAVLSKLQKKYNPDFLKKIYSSVNTTRKSLISPYEISDREFIRRWKKEQYEVNLFPKSKVFITVNGDQVRSKSELIIADCFKLLNIPYRYECKLQLGNRTIYPDFTFLDVKNKREVYFEHFGMLDNAEYLKKNLIDKLRLYEENGIRVGVDLLFTCETYDSPIDQNQVLLKLAPYKC